MFWQDLVQNFPVWTITVQYYKLKFWHSICKPKPFFMISQDLIFHKFQNFISALLLILLSFLTTFLPFSENHFFSCFIYYSVGHIFSLFGDKLDLASHMVSISSLLWEHISPELYQKQTKCMPLPNLIQIWLVVYSDKLFIVPTYLLNFANTHNALLKIYCLYNY